MGRTVARNLQIMARMGAYFEERVARPLSRNFPSARASWLGGLSPPLSPGLYARLLEDRTAECWRDDISGSHFSPFAAVRR